MIQKKLFLLIIISLAIVGCNSNIQSPTSFIECEKLGGNIAESYPRQCFYEDMGFVEEIKEIPTEPTQTYSGEIIEIEDGMDGSTITLKLNYPQIDEFEKTKIETIKTTISIPNLGIDSTFNFSNLKIGNKISVTGQTFKMNDEIHLTAEYAHTIFSQDEKTQCENSNGTYEKGGKAQIYNCNFPTKDSGNSCTDSDQCEGLCLANGVCSENTVNFGCIDILENNENVTICID